MYRAPTSSRSKKFFLHLQNRRLSCIISLAPAGVMELVDVVDSKSTAGDSVPVRVRSPAPRRSKLHIACSDFFQKSERAHCAAPPFQIEPAALGFDLVLGAVSKENRFCRLSPRRSEIRSTPFQGGPFWGRLKTAFRSFAPPFQLEPAALGFELVGGA